MSENYVDVEVELDDDVIMFLTKLAKEKGMDFNTLVNEILKEELLKYNKTVFQEDLKDEETFDKILSEVDKNVTYYICDDKECKHPVAVMVSVEIYNRMRNINGSE